MKKAFLLCMALIAPSLNAASPYGTSDTCDDQASEQWYNLGLLCLAGVSILGTRLLFQKYELLKPRVNPFGVPLEASTKTDVLDSNVQTTPLDQDPIVRMDTTEPYRAPLPVDTKSISEKKKNAKKQALYLQQEECRRLRQEQLEAFNTRDRNDHEIRPHSTRIRFDNQSLEKIQGRPPKPRSRAEKLAQRAFGAVGMAPNGQLLSSSERQGSRYTRRSMKPQQQQPIAPDDCNNDDMDLPPMADKQLEQLFSTPTNRSEAIISFDPETCREITAKEIQEWEKYDEETQECEEYNEEEEQVLKANAAHNIIVSDKDQHYPDAQKMSAAWQQGPRALKLRQREQEAAMANLTVARSGDELCTQ